MPKLSELSSSKTSRVIVYGGPKTGKTELVGNLSEKYKLIWFDLENGYETLLKLPTAQKERIEIISIPDTKVYPIAIETMLKVITGKRTDICDTHGKVSCVLCKKESRPFTTVELDTVPNDTIIVVDSLTQLSTSAMNHLTKNEADTYKPEWTDYRNQGQLMDKFLSQVQQAKYNVACITHEAEVEMEDGKKKLVPVAGTTNFSRNTAKYFDHVIYCEIKNRKHNFASSTLYAGNLVTGSRTDIVIEKRDIPTLLDIFDKSSSADDSKSAVITDKTPGQIALEKLKASKLGVNKS